MSRGAANLNSSLGYLYDSLDNDDCLLGFYEVISREFSACNVGFGWTHLQSGTRYYRSSDVNQHIQSAYVTNFEQDPWMIAGMQHPDLPTVVTGSELVAPEQYRDTDFYDKIIKPGGVEYLLCATQFDSRSLGWLAINRTVDELDFNADHKILLGTITGHLFRYIRLHQRDVLIGELPSENLIAANVSMSGIEWIDDRFRDFVKTSNEISIRGNKLVLKDQDISDQLQQEIKLICNRQLSGVKQLDIEIPTDGGSVFLQLYPKATLRPDFSRSYSALIVFRDARNPARSVERIMKEQKGCTSAEYEVARLLHDGYSPNEIAQERGVTHETVRSQLKRIFHKLDVTSQSKLVAWMNKGGNNRRG